MQSVVGAILSENMQTDQHFRSSLVLVVCSIQLWTSSSVDVSANNNVCRNLKKLDTNRFVHVSNTECKPLCGVYAHAIRRYSSKEIYL